MITTFFKRVGHLRRPIFQFPIFFFQFIFLIFAAASCVTEDVGDDTPSGNFETFWKILDEHYCFFDYKADAYGLDWNEVRSRYAPAISAGMSDEALFEVLANMVNELRDGHVNLYASHDVARYGAWFDAYAANFSDSLQRIYLGTSSDYKQTSSLKYKIFDDNIGYVHCATFSSVFGDGNLGELMRQLALCNGLIIDIRDNGGGQLTAAQKLASLFINEKTTLAYMQHKTGTAHDAFSGMEPIEQTPFSGLRWQKPVCVLTNRSTYSAANSFVMFVKGLDGVTIVGDVTGGGAGMPLSSELPNGWSLRFSACPMYDRNGALTEFGIEPDVRVDISADDYARGIDTIIEAAREILTRSAE